jgi:hypothetical protein
MRLPVHVGAVAVVASAVLASTPVPAQPPADKKGHSANIHDVGHLELGPFMTVGGLAIEQELSRPYVYVDRWREEAGFDVVDLHDPTAPHVIGRWRLEHPERHRLSRGETGKYFEIHGRYYYVKATEFEHGTLDSDIGAIVFDVTDPSNPKEVGRIRSPEFIDGFVNVFPYKHSDGRVLLFAAIRTLPTAVAPHANVYDMDRFLAGGAAQGLIGSIPMPNAERGMPRGFHDVAVEYDAGTGQDRFYGAGNGGFYVFDVSHPETPRVLTTIPVINSVAVQRAHTIVPTPDGVYVVTQMEVQFSPLMIFQLKPLDGNDRALATGPTVDSVSIPIGVWTADWHDLPHNHKIRWPYVFDAAYEDGLQVVDIRDPKNPKTVGWAYTCGCQHMTGYVDEQHIHGPSVFSGAMESDVRNADGLIVVSDLNTGFWAFRMDGFSRTSRVRRIGNVRPWRRPHARAARIDPTGTRACDSTDGAAVTARR